MATPLTPPTTTRVERNTSQAVNERIRRQMRGRVERVRSAGAGAVARRLAELEHEWDIERTLEANAAVFSLVGLTLGRTVNRRWYVFPAVVAAFLLQHAVQGWCPPIEWFRRLGIRTAREIEDERRALEGLPPAAAPEG